MRRLLTSCWFAVSIAACSSKSQNESTGPSGDGTADTSPTAPSTDSNAPEACASYPWRDAQAGEPIDTPEGAQVRDPARALSLANDFVSLPHTAAALWREGDRYKVVTATGTSVFERGRDAAGNWALQWVGTAPLNTDPMADNTLESALSHGNPADTEYSTLGYAAGDDRLSFPETSSSSYPHLMRRFSSLFDGEDAPDMALLLSPYGKGGMGSHGDADVAQSRAPLVFHGPGISPGRVSSAANHVDVAPTVAAVLGVQAVQGVDGRTGRWTENQMLKWQDGAVLDSVLQDACAYGAAAHGLILVLDGLNHNELHDGVANGRYPNFARIVNDQAAVLEGGSIVGWPSYSLPGHVSLLTGAWQGHHGLISNVFLDRSTGESGPGTSLQDMLLFADQAAAVMGDYLSPQVETLFEAVSRSRPSPDLASINELTTRGATWTGMGTPFPPPPTDISIYAMADELGIGRAEMFFEEVGAPDLMVVSLYLPDGAGQNVGPHGDEAREAIAETDARVGRLLDLYEAAGVLDQTLIVLTADHGMALMDTNRMAGWSHLFGETTVYGQMVYGL